MAASSRSAVLPDSVRLHLYCHGLGDCLLVEIPRTSGKPFWMLIDCGIHTSALGGTATIRKVVKDLGTLTDRLDVVVGTHEHWDHLSGFLQAEDLFKQLFSVGEVWFAWTENPADPDGRELDKYKGDAADALAAAANHFGAAADPEAADAMQGLLGFVFGAKGERSRDARERLRALSGNVRHLEPGTMAPLPGDVDAVRVYVLAPPRDRKLLGIVDSDEDTYRFGIGASPLAAALRNGMALEEGWLNVREDPLAPFDSGIGRPLSAALAGDVADRDVAFLSRHYAGPAEIDAFGRGEDEDFITPPREDQAWRRIDNHWLGVASDLALQLDSRTNNSSLVLAIEIVATGRVLIFAADAQVGNWRSWKDVTFPIPPGSPHGTQPVTGADLLKRAIFYKVGHHGSRNATLSKNGLELMTDPDLIAFIPTDEAMAKKVRWSDIPATRLLAELRAKTNGRVIQSDRDWIQVPGRPKEVSKGGALKDIDVVTGLRVTLEVG
jgi:hypothetical protein